MMSRMSINSSSCLEEYNALTADKAGQHLLLGHTELVTALDRGVGMMLTRNIYKLWRMPQHCDNN